MPIDRERFLRAALLLSLGGSPAVVAGCEVRTDDGTAVQPAEESSGGEGPVVEGAAPADEGAAPADEGAAPADEGAPVYE